MLGLRHLILFLVLLSPLAQGQDDLPIDDIPRPGGARAVTEVVDRAIREHRAMWAAIEEERRQWFAKRSIGGNRLTLIKDGQSLLKERLAAISRARASIFLSTYIYAVDDTAKQVTLLLCSKAREGLDVRLLVDAQGSKEFYNKHANGLRNCGAGVILYNPASWGLAQIVKTMHEKLLIIDGETVFMGGNGVQNSYHHQEPAHKFFYDMDVIAEGPVACWWHKSFVEIYTKSRQRATAFNYDPFTGERSTPISYENFLYGPRYFQDCQEVIKGESNVVPLYGNPLFSKKTPIEDAYVQAVAGTRPGGNIRLYAPYFVPTQRFVDILLWAKKNRDITVTVITNSIESNDEGWAPLVGMAYKVGQLLDAGIDMRLWKGPMTLHRKVGIYDGKWAYVGSDNLDSRGQHYNTESVLFTNDDGIVDDLVAEFIKDLENTTVLTKDYFEKIFGKRTKFQKWLIRRILKFL